MNARTGPAGRPIDPSRDAVILAATADLLGEVGWEGFTMQAVAERASVSLATIYRRWRTKSDLAVAASEYLVTGRPTDGSLAAYADLLASRTNLAPAMLSLQIAEPERSRAIHERVVKPMLEPVLQRISREADPNLSDEDARLIALIGPAVLMIRSVILGEPMTPAEVARLQSIIDHLASEPIPPRPLVTEHHLVVDGT